MMFGEGRDGDTRETIRGALIVVLIGLTLGFSYNSLARAGKPQRGLPWLAGPEPVVHLESLQPGADPAPAEPGSDHVHSDSEPPSAHDPLPDTPVSSPAPAPAPNPATGGTNPATGGTNPATHGATPPGAAAALPVVPDLDQPIELEMPSFKKFYDLDAALVIDGREPDEYEQGHIAGAINLPYNAALADPERVRTLDAGGRPIVVYCSGEHCEVSHELAAFMLEQGLKRVLVFKAGYPAWESAGYPVARGASPGARP